MNHVVIIKSSFKFFFQFRKDPRHCPSFLNSGGCLADCSASTALSSPSRCSAPRRALREARASGARSSSRLPSDVAARYNCQSKPAAKCCRFPRLFVLSRGPRPCSRSWSGRRDRRAKRRGQNDSCCAVLVRRLQQVTRRIRIEIEHSIRRLEVNFEAQQFGLVSETSDGAMTQQQGRSNALPCLLYTSPSPRDQRGSRMPSSA